MTAGAFEPVLGLLLLMGLPMDIETLKAVLTFAGVVIAALLSTWGVTAKVRADRKTTDTQQLIDRIDKLTARVDQLEKERDETRKAHEAKDEARRIEAEENRVAIRQLRDDVRDRDELILDMGDYIVAKDTHERVGGKPPAPVMSWRVRQHLIETRQTITDNLKAITENNDKD